MTTYLKPIFLFLLISWSSVVFSQKTEDVIYLSDGSVIRGMILPDSSSGKIKILNHAGDTWAFRLSDIDSITREKSFDYNADIFNKPGPEIALDGRLLVRSESNVIGKAVIPVVGLGFGYRTDAGISAGGKVSVAFYQWTEIPLSVFVRWRLSGRTVSPYLLFEGGYTIPIEEREDDWQFSYKGSGGAHLTAGVGIERILNENASLVFGFSYHHQSLNYHLTPLNEWIQERDRTEIYNRLQISLGYIFK